MRYQELNEYIDASTIDVEQLIKEIKEEARQEVNAMTPKEIFDYLKKTEAGINANRK
ncbi:MAG: hypothetical protein HC836_16715 [Richelia sp. RM2_1_2]|nr:hypothetical protein [Richelia sp. RM2_1_2]